MVVKKITITLSLIVFTLLAAIQPSVAGKNDSLLSETAALKALMKNQDVLLKDSKYCSGAGTSESDRTIGDYLSGFWVFHTNKDGRNWLDIQVSKTADNMRLAKVMIYRKNGEENWGWGVSFKLDNKANVLRDSFSFLGGG
ncbi:hypothetical protein MNBD_GAMMA23-1274 [hydrothermal vent metagenome]|uniref:Uncharacterized protein n=1 Tax=hydrothermal vent metagenome TaxID=652676 RepID=A0A3B1AC64_9ZZZZ